MMAGIGIWCFGRALAMAQVTLLNLTGIPQRLCKQSGHQIPKVVVPKSIKQLLLSKCMFARCGIAQPRFHSLE